VIFGPVHLEQATGAILAHSLNLTSGALRKGIILLPAHIDAIRADGISQVVIARLEAGDLSEDAAAEKVGATLENKGLTLSSVFTGRVNVLAAQAGVMRIDSAAVSAFNAIDEGLTLATLSDYMRVEKDQLVATVKVIPYGIEAIMAAAGIIALGQSALTLHPFVGGTARLIMTQTSGFKESLLAKGEAIVRNRLEALAYDLVEVVTVPHTQDAVAQALHAPVDLQLILGASATSDRADVAPSAVVRAGGCIDRFGMPVDPGNLLFLGTLDGAPVVGLPGCARSPALNGVDWVLERLAARLPVDGAAIAEMGVGGLLKEMPNRPQPRRPRA
jgi:molybdenum cofactor cytidylyltransferase